MEEKPLNYGTASKWYFTIELKQFDNLFCIEGLIFENIPFYIILNCSAKRSLGIIAIRCNIKFVDVFVEQK